MSYICTLFVQNWELSVLMTLNNQKKDLMLIKIEECKKSNFNYEAVTLKLISEIISFK